MKVLTPSQRSKALLVAGMLLLLGFCFFVSSTTRNRGLPRSTAAMTSNAPIDSTSQPTETPAVAVSAAPVDSTAQPTEIPAVAVSAAPVDSIAQPTESSTAGEPKPPKATMPMDVMCELHFDPMAKTEWEIDKNAYAAVGCPKRVAIKCKKKLGKALVIYMLHTKSAHDVQPEFWNFHYFTKFGIFGENESTEMFTRVDYVFSRMVPRLDATTPEVTNVTLCSERENVRLVSVPPAACDLCHHSRVIDFIGGPDVVGSEYAYVVYLNAGVRGPFQHVDDAQWIDVIAMGGQRYWGGPDSHPIVTGLTLSHELRPHIQSFLMGFPTATALPLVQRVLRHTCTSPVKRFCIVEGETALGNLLLDAGFWLHTTIRNFTLHTTEEIEGYKQRILNWKFRSGPAHFGLDNPLYTELDLCAGVFSKFGGNYIKSVPAKVVASFAQLTSLQSTKRQLQGHDTISAMLQSGGSKCPWLAID